MRSRLAISLVALILLAAIGTLVVNVWPDEVYCRYVVVREWAAILGSGHSYRAVAELPPSMLPLSDHRLPDVTHFTVLPSSEASRLRTLCSRSALRAEGTWKPSEAEIAELESGLRRIELLEENDVLSGIQIVDPVVAHRQYLPVIVHGRRVIYINAAFMLEAPDANWRYHLSDICDGGAYVWGALYDPATLEFSDLEINSGMKADHVHRQTHFYF
jgi:hypothetical protein